MAPEQASAVGHCALHETMAQAMAEGPRAAWANVGVKRAPETAPETVPEDVAKVAVRLGEPALQHQNLFAQFVCVRFER